MNITINDVLYAVLTICLPYVIKLLADYVKLRTADSRYGQAVSAVADAVSAINQTYVSKLKEQGEFSAKSQEIARRLAVQQAMSMMSNATQSYINDNCGDIESFIIGQIEANKGRENHEQASGIVSTD